MLLISLMSATGVFLSAGEQESGVHEHSELENPVQRLHVMSDQK